MAVLICGSIAYDNIMVFEERFKDYILPNQLHTLNVSFLVPEIRCSYGGCAGNIVYGLSLLGTPAYPLSTVGHDFTKYEIWMKEHGIDRKYIHTIESQYTAQAHIITDIEDNQITAFHPGAMDVSDSIDVPLDKDIQLGVIAPESRAGMLQHAQQLKDANIPYIFDPGQGTPMFATEELTFFLEGADWLACNDYESQLIAERMGMPLERIADTVQALIVTSGGNGSIIYTKGKKIELAAVKPEQVLDPTGCGDAYRAGLIYGMVNKFDWKTTGRIASLMGSIKVAHNGCQNYHFTQDEFADYFMKEFAYRF